MNDQTAQLLEKLATKLGTTTEYLWAVLIKQAAISSTIDVLCWLTGVFVCFFAARMTLKAIVKLDGPSGTEQSADVAIAIFGGVVALFFFFACAFSLSSAALVFSGWFNPEYWALQEVLKAVR